MKILCGTDFSTDSQRATRTAAQLARRFGDTLVLVHSIPPLTLPVDAAAAMSELFVRQRQAAEKELSDEAIALRAEGATVETALLDGYPDHTLAERARTLGARLIVIGSHGRRAPARWFLGSVAERLVDAADRPVLVDCGGSQGLGAWASGRRPLELMVGVDLSRSSDVALEWVRTLRHVGPVNVTLTHFYWPPAEYQRLGLEGPREILAADPEVLAVIERELLVRFGELPGEGTVSVRARPNWGELGAALRLDAFYEGADLVLLGTHQRTGLGRLWHGSVAHSVLHSARLPVICVPLQAEHERKSEPIPPLRHVLVATDFSDLGNAAIPHAYAMARGGGVVELCTVFERPVPMPIHVEPPRNLPRCSPQHRAELEGRLRALVPPDATAAAVTTRISVLEGPHPGEVIDQAAQRLGVDAVCLGTHARSGLGNTFIESVVQDVIHRSSRPVIVVPLRRPN